MTKRRRPIWRTRAVCRDGHIVAERLFDPAEATIHDAIVALEAGIAAWCPACGADEMFYDATPTRFYSLSAARGELESARN